MRISIEFKNGKYKVTYGKIVGVGTTPAEAIAQMVDLFRSQLEKFFIVAK